MKLSLDHRKVNFRYMKYFVLSLVTLMSFNQLFAQDTTVVSLQNAVQMGLDSSKLIKISQSKIDEARAQLAEARQKFYPTVDLSGTYLRVNSPSISTEFNTSGNNENQGGGGSQIPEISQAAIGQLSVTQPIFAGLKIRNYAASANYLEQAAHLDAQNQKSEVLFNIISAYFNFYKLQSTRKAVLQGLGQAKRRVKDFENLQKNGLMTRNDLLQAQLQQSKMELALTNVDNQIDIANFQLNILLGLPDHTIIGIDSASIPDKLNEAQSLDYYLQNYTNRRMDLLASKKMENAASSKVKAAKGDYFPSVALTGGYIDLKVPGAITVVNAMNVGIGLKYSLSGIFDAHHAVQQTIAQEHQSELRTAMLDDNIRTEIHTAYANYVKSLKQLQTLREATKQAQENYRVTKNSYENSVAILSDLLDAETTQIQANVDLRNAQVDAEVSYYNLEKAAGLLKNEFTIEKN